MQFPAFRLLPATLFLVSAALLSAGEPTEPAEAPAAKGTEDNKQENLRKLVCDYLDAETKEQREAALKKIAELQVGVEELAKVCAAPRKYGKQEAGTKTGLKVKVKGEEETYFLAVPETYTPEKPTPLLLCLHGAGYTGEKQMERWGPPAVKKGYLVVAPTSKNGWGGNGEPIVMAVLREVRKSYNVDPNRIYVTGISMGGHGIWYVAPRHPDLFAAVVPIAGAAGDLSKPLFPNLLHTPAYIIHGSKDNVVPVRLGQETHNILKNLGYEVIYKEHDKRKDFAEGHIHPEWEVPDILNFLDAKKRNPFPEKVVLVADDLPAQSFWLRIDQKIEDKRARAEAVRDKDGVTIKTENVKRLTLFFPAAVKTKVTVNGKEVVLDGDAPKESVEAILESARHDCGGGMLFRAKMVIDVQ